MRSFDNIFRHLQRQKFVRLEKARIEKLDSMSKRSSRRVLVVDHLWPSLLWNVLGAGSQPSVGNRRLAEEYSFSFAYNLPSSCWHFLPHGRTADDMELHEDVWRVSFCVKCVFMLIYLRISETISMSSKFTSTGSFATLRCWFSCFCSSYHFHLTSDQVQYSISLSKTGFPIATIFGGLRSFMSQRTRTSIIFAWTGLGTYRLTSSCLCCHQFWCIRLGDGGGSSSECSRFWFCSAWSTFS